MQRNLCRMAQSVRSREGIQHAQGQSLGSAHSSFHWLLAILVVAAYVTAQIGGSLIEWHGRVGIAITGLLAFRLVWG